MPEDVDSPNATSEKVFAVAMDTKEKDLELGCDKCYRMGPGHSGDHVPAVPKTI